MASQDRFKYLVGSIDIGTTFSSWAFSFRHEYKENPTKIYAKFWNDRHRLSEKAPTAVLISSDGKTLKAFGYDAEEQYAKRRNRNKCYYFERFKMALYENKTLNRETTIDDVNYKKLKAMTVFSLVIKYLKENLVEECRQKIKTDAFHEEDILWVLTVPAIWNDNAKQFMREAAFQAGIKDEHLMIALEPESASVFSRHLRLQVMSSAEEITAVHLTPGTRYILIDAGGGTVDITAHEILKDGTLKELCPAAGGPYGGMEVDSAFRQFLVTIFGNRILQKFKTEAMNDYISLFRTFELKKRIVTPDGKKKTVIELPKTLIDIFQGDSEENLKECIAQTKFASKVEVLKGNKLRIRPSVMRSFFKYSTKNVVNLIQSFSLSYTYGVSLALMVGGFSESAMLTNAVRKAFPSWQVVVPQEAGLAVLKGAVIFGHNPTEFRYRISRHTYGFATTVPFIDGEHPDEYVIFCDGEKQCRHVFISFLRKGELVQNGQVLVDGTTFFPQKDTNTLNIQIYASTNESVRYTTDDSCTRLGVLRIDKLDMTIPRKKRLASVSIKVSYSELHVEAIDLNTNRFLKTCIDFLE